MGFKKWIEALGFGAAAASGMGAEQVAQAAEKQQTPHVEVNRNPDVEFRNAKQAIVDALNESTFDATSGGKLEGKNWSATVEEKGDDLVAKITVNAGGETKTEEFDLRKDEIDGPNSSKKDVYSFATGVAKSTEKQLRDQEALLAAVRGDVARAAGKDQVAMNDQESGK